MVQAGNACFEKIPGLPGRSLNDRKNVALLDDRELFAVYLEVGARILGAEHFVADLDLHDDFFSVYNTAGSDGYDDARLRFLLRRRGQVKSALGLFLDGNRFNDYLIEQRFDVHVDLRNNMFFVIAYIITTRRGASNTFSGIFRKIKQEFPVFFSVR